MGLFGLLGPIEFETLTSPGEFRSRQQFTYATHDVVEDRPRLQWLSVDLEELRLRLKWHIAFTDPQAQFDAMQAAAVAHTALPLCFGNGLFRGYYVITELGEQLRQTADDGSLMILECEVTLREYAFTPAQDGAPVPDEPPPAIAPTQPVQPGTSAVSAPPPDPRDTGGSFANMSFANVPVEVVTRTPQVGGAGGDW